MRAPVLLTRSVILRLLVISVALNWAWEMAHMEAYTDMAGRSWQSTVWRCFRASMGDAALTLVSSAGAAHLAPVPPRTYAFAAGLACAIAVILERAALALGAWSYSGRMPLVPLLDVGVWPVLQLTLLVPLALWAAVRRWGA